MGGSGLSGGAIAGIVIGTVVGALLFCLLCFALGLARSGSKKDGTTTTKYNNQTDESRMGQASQVEMSSNQPAHDGEAITEA